MNAVNHLPTRRIDGPERWGRLDDGRPVHRWILRNAQDMRVEIADLGGSLLSWLAPDRHGRLGEVLLGHASPADYAHGHWYMGALIGRWANRIRDGRFVLDGIPYRVDRNDHGQHLHGGLEGFHRALWQVEPADGGLCLRLHSPDGEGGFPGDLDVEVRYRLHDDGSLSIDYDACCNLPTPINLTAHPYFDLSGNGGGVGEHMLKIAAGHYLAVDAAMIPIACESVAGTPFDFRHPAPLGARLAWPHPQLAIAQGFDHCFVLDGEPGQARPVAELYAPASGRRLSVSTDQPGLQLYTGQHLTGAPDRRGGSYRAGAGLCLEAQAFPNQINSDRAAQVVLRPGARYRQHTVYRLDAV
ncbi:aldose epimerase family protein [Aerosticca soli]|uniref:Aldose 1-epimerase n=1 Tax=Aerosticca soli TaxID=2010829 RepID=A0A2Z6E920_9GAMM|nr:aldose epimerase family protein [Aerosticca soli]BBD81324.1 aldose 1-epimerase [Aerosticca soli]